MDEKYHAQLQLRRRLWNTGLLAATLASPLSLMAANLPDEISAADQCTPVADQMAPQTLHNQKDSNRKDSNRKDKDSWKQLPVKHPLQNAAAQGITEDDLDNGRVGFDAYITTDPCGNRQAVQKMVRIKPEKAAKTEKVDKFRKPQTKITGVRFDPAVLNEAIAIIRFKRPQLENVQLARDKAMLRGEIKTRGDSQRVHQQILDKRKAKLDDYMAKKLAALDAAGVEVLGHSALSASAEVRLTPELQASLRAASAGKRLSAGRQQLSTGGKQPLLKIPGLFSIERKLEVAPNSLNGDTVNQGIQADQMISRNFQGWEANSGRQSVAVIETANGLGDGQHPGFIEWDGVNTRLVNQFDCSSGSCEKVSYLDADMGVSPGHALAVTGIVAGDITEGQDSSISSSQARRERSGVAQEAAIYAFYDRYGTRAMDYATYWASYFDVINNSWASSAAGCSGQTYMDISANGAYEAGIAVINSAANEYHTQGCSLRAPATAIGVFTVGGHTNYYDIWNTGLENTRNGDIYTQSSRGGDTSGRTAVDITAPACRGYMFDSSDGYNKSGCGTSYAAPAVAGTALNFISWWNQTGYGSYWIEQPGIIYTNLLLMGDGQQESSNPANQYKETGFDNLWGAGRLKARLWDTTGLDTPYSWSTGERCVAQGESVYIDTWNSSVVSSDVDVMKAVIWWYDRRHENGQQIDNIDLSVQRLSSNGSWYTRRSSTSLTDNKERVVLHDFSGSYSARHRLKISGYRVTADAEGCGTNKMKVYYAYYYEDSDRDDSDGPNWNSSTQIGVEPQAQD